MTNLQQYIKKRSDLWAVLSLYSLCVTGFLISFPRLLVLYGMGAFLTFSLLCWIADIKSKLFVLRQHLYIILPFAGYFLLYLLYSEYEGMSWRHIEPRLIFILFPLVGIGALSCKRFINGGYLKFIKSFIAGIFVISLVLLIRLVLIQAGILQRPEILVYSIEAANTSFLSSTLSFFQHPAYFSMEINLAIAFLIVTGKDFKWSLIVRILLVVYYIIFIYLLSSRAGIIACLFLLMLLFYLRMKEKISGKFLNLVITGTVAIVLLMVVLLNPKISRLVDGIRDAVKGDKMSLTDVEPRTRVWISALNLISDKPVLGLGLKQLDQKRLDEYRRNGYYSEAFFNLNTHNQFLETQLTFGIPGTFFLIWMLIAPLFGKRYLSNERIYYCFLLIIIIQFMFESMLVRQSGIIFFVVISCLQINLRTDSLEVVT